ncbi:hypothetical protein MMC34_007466 [Xylographa carneopallida]|nr:hypothetical protein [Xylographa carneopallida]
MLLISVARTLFTSSIVFGWVVAVRQSICDGDLYGHPNTNECFTRLSRLEHSIDERHHFFALPTVTRRPQHPFNNALDVSQHKWRNNRVQLPVVERAVQGPSRCSLGIFPIEFPDGSLTWDMGFYRYMARDGRFTVIDCLNSRPNGPGGRILTGTNDRLALILYEPGSEWDFLVQAAEAQKRPIYVPLNAAGNPPVAGLLQSTSAATTATAATTSVTTGRPNPTMKPEPGIKPGPGVKPNLARFGNPWSQWGSGFGQEGQGSSWE